MANGRFPASRVVTEAALNAADALGGGVPSLWMARLSARSENGAFPGNFPAARRETLGGRSHSSQDEWNSVTPCPAR